MRSLVEDELNEIKRLFQPMIESFPICQSEFWHQGFRAFEQHHKWIVDHGSAYPECTRVLGSCDPEQPALSDMVIPCINGTLWALDEISPQSRYIDCLSRSLRQEKRSEWSEQISRGRWYFTEEANAYEEIEHDKKTKQSQIISQMLIESLAQRGFQSKINSAIYSKLLFPLPTIENLTIEVQVSKILRLLIVVGTDSSKKRKNLNRKTEELKILGTDFDIMYANFWLMPTRTIGQFGSLTFWVRNLLAPNYIFFHGLKGLQRIFDAHSCALSIFHQRRR
jgi:hypothetical protein